MQQNQLKINRSLTNDINRWPAIVNILAIAGAGSLLIAFALWTVYQSEQALNANVANKLETILKIETEAVRQWVRSERELAILLASDSSLAEMILRNEPDSEIENASIKVQLDSTSKKLQGRTLLLWTEDGTFIASSGESWLKQQLSSLGRQLRSALISGETTVSPILGAADDSSNEFKSVLIVAAPVHHPENGVVGFLGIGHDVRDELTMLLSSSRSGKSGETIAVTRTGRLISNSRFQTMAQRLSYFENAHQDNAELTSSAIKTDLQGHPDHRGANCVYASRWLPALGMGLVTKLERTEANAPVSKMRAFVWTLFVLLVGTTISTLFYRWYVHRLRLLARQADLHRKQLGAYELEGKIGEGGMGVVYRAKHALMRRPTAIKILPPEKSCQSSIERFEREVKYTSQLKHPNTISIYDYGRSENGLFYYAMELLDGVNLDQLARQDGPVSDGRAIEILRQVCESLREAHSRNLIHRDIKPANIMLCDRGSGEDTVKVLDFGMVRDHSRSEVDSAHTLSGTPAYMAPECFSNPREVDTRIDVFAVGAVGFFLLTGRALFEVNQLSDLLQLHKTDIKAFAIEQLNATSKQNPTLIAEQLIQLIGRCVESDREMRPNSISEVLKMLLGMKANNAWSTLDSEKWWLAMDSSTSKEVDSSTARSLEETKAFTPAFKLKVFAKT